MRPFSVTGVLFGSGLAGLCQPRAAQGAACDDFDFPVIVLIPVCVCVCA